MDKRKGRPRKLSESNRSRITFEHLRHGVRTIVLARYWEVSQRTIQRIVKEGIGLLSSAELTSPLSDVGLCLIDGTVIGTHRKPDHFSGHKKRYGIRLVALTDLNGRWLRRWMLPGKWVDQSVVCQKNLNEQLAGLTVVTDKGFKFDASVNQMVDEKQLGGIGKIRWPVERTFSRLKRNPWPHNNPELKKR